MKFFRRFTLPIVIVFILSSLAFSNFNNGKTKVTLENINNLYISSKAPTQKLTELASLVKLKQLSKLDINSKAAILIEADTGEILYEKNRQQSLPIASMSKIMTQLLVLEAIHSGNIAWEDNVIISDYSYSISHKPGYSSAKLRQDVPYTVEQLFKAMSIRSANGATIALAEHVASNEREFVQRMNTKADELGLKETMFYNSTGITNKDLNGFHSVGSAEDTNQMSAEDLAKLAAYLINNYPEILTITKIPEFHFNGEDHINSNFMLPNNQLPFPTEDIIFPNVDGLKTGYTDAAKDCFTGTVTIAGRRFISVIMGSDDRFQKFAETKLLYEGIQKQLIFD